MKIQLMSLGIAIACLTQAAFAQQQPAEAAGSSSEHSFQASKVIGKRAKSAQGDEIGRITDLVINPQTTETFAIVDLGRRRGLAPIPLQLLNLNAAPDQRDIMVNKSKDVLNSAPTVTEQQWGNFNDPKFTQRIYAYFGVPAPTSAMGAPAPAPEGTEEGTVHGPGEKPSEHPSEPPPATGKP